MACERPGCEFEWCRGGPSGCFEVDGIQYFYQADHVHARDIIAEIPDTCADKHKFDTPPRLSEIPDDCLCYATNTQPGVVGDPDVMEEATYYERSNRIRKNLIADGVCERCWLKYALCQSAAECADHGYNPIPIGVVR